MNVHPYWTKAAIVCLVFFTFTGGIWFSLETTQTAAFPKISQRSISVSGDSEVTAIPDLATINFSLNSYGPTSEKTSSGLKTVMGKIKELAQAAGVEEKYITQSQYSGGEGNTSGNISVTFTDIANKQGVIDTFTTNALKESIKPKNEPEPITVQVFLNNTCFGYKDLGATQAPGREKALQAAVQKALEYATHSGQKLGRVTNIIDNSVSQTGYGGGGYGNNCFGSTVLDSKTVPEQIMFVNISATFELQ